MTRHETIIAGRARRSVRVERRRTWSRGEVHAAGLAAVADALCPLGGPLVGGDVGRILAGRQPEAAGCRPREATRPEIRPDLSTGRLVADIRRLIRPETGTFGRELWSKGL